MRAAQWIVAVLVGFGLCAHQTEAADAVDRYPNKPIRIVVGSTPGSTPDVLARLIGAKLGDSWKQAVVIENRVPGVIGYNAVAKSTPDAYTLLLASPALAIRAVVSTNLPYDTLKEFVGVTEIGFSNVVVVVGRAIHRRALRYADGDPRAVEQGGRTHPRHARRAGVAERRGVPHHALDTARA